MLKKTARHWGLMNAMFRKAGVDLSAGLVEERLDLDDIRDAVVRCADCPQVNDCEHHLADTRTSGVPSYCRNAELIARLAP